MSKIAITADFHWGVPGRLQDTHWASRVVSTYCEQKDIDTVLVLGDLVHDRASIDLDVWNTLYDFLSDTRKKGQNWYAFPGNHDMFLKHSWEFNALNPLRDQLHIIDRVSLMTIDDRRFFILPFIHLEKSYMRTLRKLEEHYQEGDTLLTHIGVRGATLNTCFLLKDWSFVDFTNSKFRRIYTGHFHSRQSLDNQVYYPGSPIPFKFDEGDVPHGFYVLDLETMEHKFVDIWKWGASLFPDEPMPPQFYTVLEEQLEDLEEHIVANNMVRIAHKRDIGQDERTQIKNKLEEMGGKAVRWLTLKQDSPTVALKPSTTPLADPGDLFDWWLKQDIDGTANLDTNLLREYNAEVCHEGDERYVYAEE